MANVIVSRGEAATLAQIKQAAIDQLGLSPEQVAEVEAISTKAAIKQWLSDNGHDITDEVAPVNTASSNTNTISFKDQSGVNRVYRIGKSSLVSRSNQKLIGAIASAQVIRSMSNGMNDVLQLSVVLPNGNTYDAQMPAPQALVLGASFGFDGAQKAVAAYQAKYAGKRGNPNDDDAVRIMNQLFGDDSSFQLPSDAAVVIEGSQRTKETCFYLPLAAADNTTKEEVAQEFDISPSVIEKITVEIGSQNRTPHVTESGDVVYAVPVYFDSEGINVRSAKATSALAYSAAVKKFEAEQKESSQMRLLEFQSRLTDGSPARQMSEVAKLLKTGEFAIEELDLASTLLGRIKQIA